MHHEEIARSVRKKIALSVRSAIRSNPFHTSPAWCNDSMVRPADVVGFLLNETALPREALGAIHILPKHTLFDVREEFARDMVKVLHGARFKGRKLIVGVAKV